MRQLKLGPVLLLGLCHAVLHPQPESAATFHALTRSGRFATAIAFRHCADVALNQFAGSRCVGATLFIPLPQQDFGRAALPAGLRLPDLIIPFPRP